MGRFSSFAVSFSLISVLTGIFANFDFGIRQAGGDIVWTWLLVAAGQTLVALVMANLSVRFPIAGYGYQWAARLASTTTAASQPAIPSHVIAAQATATTTTSHE
jgi:amino acid transporter